MHRNRFPVELKFVENNFRWNSSIIHSSFYSAQIKKGEIEGKTTFAWVVGSIQAWVHRFRRLGRGFRRLGCGFTAWVHGFCYLGSPSMVESFMWFYFDPCLCLCLCFCCLFGCRGFFYFLFFTFFCQRGRRGRRRVSQLFGFLLWNSSVEKSNSRQIFIEIEFVILNLLQRSQPSHSRDVSLLNNLEMMLTNKIVLILVLFSKKKKIPTQWHVAKKRTLFFNTR